MSDADETIESLTKLVNKLSSQLNEANARLKEKQVESASIKYGVKVGSIVEDQFGKRYRVTKIEFRCSNDFPPWLMVNPQRKDGTFGTASRRLFADWKVCQRD